LLPLINLNVSAEKRGAQTVQVRVNSRRPAYLFFVMKLVHSLTAWIAACTILAAIYGDGIAVAAFFTGPDGCAEGGNAGGLVDIVGAQEVPFATSGIEFTINGQAITEGSDILLEINGGYDFSIAASGANTFVGGLIRVQQGVDASTFSFAPSVTPNVPDSEVATACQAPAKGVTQIESTLENTTLTGRFVSSSLGTVTIEVTVVLTNSTQAGLTYSYAQFEVDTTAPENPAPTPTAIDTLEPTTTRPPTFSPAPTFVEVCDICASPDLSITLLDATVIINGVSATCGLISQIADARLVPPGQPCNDTIAAVVQNCGCSPNEPSSPTMLPVDTLAPTTTTAVAPTISPAPTFVEVCYICGSPDSSITMPDAAVIINGVSATCGLIAQIANGRLVPPGQACDDTIAAVIQSCGCSPSEPIVPTTTPLPLPLPPPPSPTTPPPSSSPLPIAFTTAEPYTSPDDKPSDGGKGGKMGTGKKGSSKGGKGNGSKDGKGMGKSRNSSKGGKGKGKGNGDGKGGSKGDSKRKMMRKDRLLRSRPWRVSGHEVDGSIV
jgi:uncharacterized membrane protein YgcG